ncbi:hypothetical protein FQN55_007781 [Onygenales sp. PD_40]|nr:hypothetical protein FQN55_007781 [Onygenales sp. PD_40]KAK2781286.1 hypothetical protein FQN52_001720 [Onygenales sp. PD_12]
MNSDKEASNCTGSRTSLSDLEDSPLTGDQERFPMRASRRIRFQWPRNENPFWKWWSLAMTICSIVLLGGLISGINIRQCSESPGATSPPLSYPHPKDTWKQENLIETKYYRDLRFMTLDHSLDYVWQEHVLMSTGNIRLPDGKGNTSLKSIAMFHQMHCLAKMRLALQQAQEGLDVGVDWKDDAHWPHCLDYLRSSIMCFADGTLESITAQPGPVEGTVVKVIDGATEMRYCRDTKPLYDLERQYGPNSHYIDENGETGPFEVAPGR